MKSAYRPKWKNPFFSYGSLVYETSSYPMSLICCFRYGISSGRFADDNGLAAFCRRVYFLWRAALADYIIHMGFAHAAHHTINF